MCASLAKFGLSEGDLDDVLVFWRSGEERRAVLTRDYTECRNYLNRLLLRIHASSLEQSLASQLTGLRAPGTSVVVHSGAHALGLMRPLLLDSGALDAAETEAFLIAFESGRGAAPQMPVLGSSRQRVNRLVRELDLAGEAEQAGWRSYQCERLKGTLEKVLDDLFHGYVQSSFATELERQLWFADHPDPRPGQQRRRAA